MSGSERRSRLLQHHHRHCRRHQIRAHAHRKAPVRRVACQHELARPQRDGKPTAAARVVSRKPTVPSHLARRERRISSALPLESAERHPLVPRLASTHRETDGSLPTEARSTDASASDRMRRLTVSRTAARSHDPEPRLVRPLPQPSSPRRRSTPRMVPPSRHHLLQSRGLASQRTGYHLSPLSLHQKTQTGTTSFSRLLRRSWVFRHSPTLGTDTAATSPSPVLWRLARAAQVERQGKTTWLSSGIETESRFDGRSSRRNRNERLSRCRQCGRVWRLRANSARCLLRLRNHRYRRRCLLPRLLVTPSNPTTMVTADRPMLRCSSLPPTRSTITSLLARWSVLALLLFLRSSR